MKICLTNPKKNASFEDSEAAYFLAYRDGKVVGRIAAIIIHPFNEKNKCKYARFSRFDVINDKDVERAINAVHDKFALGEAE